MKTLKFMEWKKFITLHSTLYMYYPIWSYCAVPENIHTPPTEGIGISWGVGGSVRPKNLKKCMKLKWYFQRGGGLRKNPFHGGGMDIIWNYTFIKISCSDM